MRYWSNSKNKNFTERNHQTEFCQQIICRQEAEQEGDLVTSYSAVCQNRGFLNCQICLLPNNPVSLELGISQFFYDWKNKQDDIAGCRCLIWPNICELSPTPATGHSCKKTNPI